MPLYEFEGKSPRLASSSFVHPDAILIGDVVIGEKCFIGAGAVLRGDYGSIVIGNGSNVQENCVLHAQPDTVAVVEEDVDIGHGSHCSWSCTIKAMSQSGWVQSYVDGCEVGTGSFNWCRQSADPKNGNSYYKLAVGNPARVIKDATEQHRTFSKVAVGLYQGLCERYQHTLKRIER